MSDDPDLEMLDDGAPVAAPLTSAVVRRAEAAVNTAPSEITALMRMVLEKDGSVETLERLVALHERVTDRAAAAEFAAALADFQAECPPIQKKRTARIVTNAGSNYSYNFADLSDIAAVVRPLLHARGFSYTWDSEFTDRLLACTCILTHVNGHTKTATFKCPIESKAGMGEQQKHGAALTFAKRASLTQVLGITTADPDTDGANPEPITREQAEELERLADEVKADRVKFLSFMGYASFGEILRTDFNRAKTALESKRKPAQRRG